MEMIVKVVANTAKRFSQNPPNDLYRNDKFFSLTIGDSYVVYGINIQGGVLHYLTCHKITDDPYWMPAELFEIVDYRLPPVWYFMFFGYGKSNKINAVWGYEELVMDPKHYAALILREGYWHVIFELRKKEIDEYFSQNH
jgi:hypothetical protein